MKNQAVNYNVAIAWLDISPESQFPNIKQSLDNGLLAAGGDLSPQRLLKAYRNGIFPWFNEHDPILWWSPDPRMILFTDQIKLSTSLKKTLKTTPLTVTIDQAFVDVMTACAAPRKNTTGGIAPSTWIHPEMVGAYSALHQQGIAHSVECWQNGQLVAGLYGVAIGRLFFGESMFSNVRDASKIALVTLCRQLECWGFPLIDCQIYSDHLASMGAIEIDRKQFISYLDTYCPQMHNNRWQIDNDLQLIP